MSRYLISWFRALLRPTITQVNVVVYENGKQKDISLYNDQQLHKIQDCVNMLWKVPDKSSYWFETEVWEKRRCFQKATTHMTVVCYKEDMMANGFKSKMAIPIKYRKKMFDQYHTISPESIPSRKWPDKMVVLFRIDM